MVFSISFLGIRIVLILAKIRGVHLSWIYTIPLFFYGMKLFFDERGGAVNNLQKGGMG